MKLSVAIDLYIAKRQAMGEKFYSPAAVLRALSRSHGEIELSSLTPGQVSSFLAGPRTGPATWRHKYGTLRVFFEHWRLREVTRFLCRLRPRSTRPASFPISTLSLSCGCCWLPFLAACRASCASCRQRRSVRCCSCSMAQGCESARRCGCELRTSISTRVSSRCVEQSSTSRAWCRSGRMFTLIFESMLPCRGGRTATIYRSSNPVCARP